MRKQLRKIALAVVFTMAATMFAPASQTALAAKTFSYAEQKTGEQVTSLFMERGEKVDLKFMGISDYKNYKLKWISSNEKVAVVDSSGIITALTNGTATIQLKVGDGKNYTSTGVVVHVGKQQEVTIGTAAKAEIKSYTLEVGKSVVLRANGLSDNVGGRYTFAWSSTDTSVAKISNNGILTAEAPGLTVIQLTAKKTANGEELKATPIAVLVTTSGTSAPVATATPTPTTKPNATVTPTPTVKPNANATPTPVIANGSYSVTVSSDKSVILTFPSKVSYTASDIELSEVLVANGEDILIKQDIKSAELDETGKKLTITTESPLITSKYNIKVGTSDSGRTFPVSLGVPNRMEVVYKCLGREGTAYAYDDEAGIDVPVSLEYRLYYGNIDVTESYRDSGYVTFDLVSPTNSEYVMLEGEQLYFYKSKMSAVVNGTYTYYTESGAEKELKGAANIVSREIGDYAITHVVKWTIIDETDNNATIDWDSPVTKVVAGKENYKVVALLADSYGYYYSTDPRGADKSKNIYSIDDDETLFTMKGYSYSFDTSNADDFYIEGTGELYPYQAESRAAVYITLHNPDEWTSGERKLGAWQFTIQEKSKLTSIKLKQSSVTLLSSANDEERFCTAQIPVLLYDQYNYEWKGDANLSVSSSVPAIENAIGSIASVEQVNGEGDWVLKVDGRGLAGINKTQATLYVTDLNTNKRATISVQVKNPADKNTGIITVNNWAVGMKEREITFGDGSKDEYNAVAEVEIYQVSKNGNYNVGFIDNRSTDEYGFNNTIHLLTKNNTIPSNAQPGDVYVYVTGPNAKPATIAASSSDLGVYQDPASGRIFVNVTQFSGESLTCLAEGKYTVRVTKIGKNGSKSPKSTDFTVVDKTKDVTIAGYNGYRTSQVVSGTSDDTIKDIVLELFKFKLGGAEWNTITRKMITKVTYSEPVNNKIRITEIEFAVPADGKSESDVVTYQKKLTGLNVSVTIGVN